MNQNPANETGAGAGSQAESEQSVGTKTKTKRQIAAAFEAVFGNVAAAKRKTEKITAAKRLEPYRKAVLRLRQAGVSWKKIAKGMHHPRIAERVTAESLKAVFGTLPAAGAKPADEPNSDRTGG